MVSRMGKQGLKQSAKAPASKEGRMAITSIPCGHIRHIHHAPCEDQGWEDVHKAHGRVHRGEGRRDHWRRGHRGNDHHEERAGLHMGLQVGSDRHEGRAGSPRLGEEVREREEVAESEVDTAPVRGDRRSIREEEGYGDGSHHVEDCIREEVRDDHSSSRREEDRSRDEEAAIANGSGRVVVQEEDHEEAPTAGQRCTGLGRP